MPNIILKKTKNNCFYNIKVNDEIKITYFKESITSIIKKDKINECIYDAKSNSIKKVSTKIDIYGKQLVFFNDINSSFYNSALSSGMNPNEIMSLADIFGWDIDFVKDIRNGDRFGVVINRNYSNNILKDSLIEYAFFKK